MQFRNFFTGLSFFVCAVLAGCGGNGGDSGSTAASAEAKATVRQKTAASDYNNTVQELYIAYFGRPADPGGLAGFEAALQSAGAPTDMPSLAAAYNTNAAVKSLIDSFGNSKESNTLYAGATTSAFVTAIFQSVLGRAPAAAGLSYWTNAIDNEGVSKGNAAASIMAGAMTNTTAAGLTDAQTIKNKVAVASNFTTAVGTSPSVYAGAVAAASARNLLAQVLSTTDPAAFQSTIAAMISNISTADNTASLSLTTTTPSSPSVVVGNFNGSTSNCGSTFGMSGCGLTPAGVTCDMYTNSGVQFISSATASFNDATGRNLTIQLLSYSLGDEPLTAGLIIDGSGEQLYGFARVIFTDSLGQFVTANGPLTVTAVSSTGVTLSFNNVSAIFFANDSRLNGTQVLNGTVQFNCDPSRTKTN